MYELDLKLVVQGITWLLSTGAGAFGSYKILQYRITRVESDQKELAEEVKKDVVHFSHCVSCKENIGLKIQMEGRSSHE
jgi:hypothetical protein